jgi:hypothetical protein
LAGSNWPVFIAAVVGRDVSSARTAATIRRTIS